MQNTIILNNKIMLTSILLTTISTGAVVTVLSFVIVLCWTAVYFSQESLSEQNDKRFKGIYSSDNYYE